MHVLKKKGGQERQPLGLITRRTKVVHYGYQRTFVFSPYLVGSFLFAPSSYLPGYCMLPCDLILHHPIIPSDDDDDDDEAGHLEDDDDGRNTS